MTTVEFRDATLVVGRGRVARPLFCGFSRVFRAGCVTAVVGPSGSGKTSLLRAVLGEVPLSAGSVHVAGRDVGRLRDKSALRRTSVTTIAQDLNLVDTLTAEENVLFGLRVAGVRGAEAQVEGWFERLGIADVRTMLPTTLSGGERQRVAIARSLASPHPVVLADEPTGALDEENTRIVVEQLKYFSSEGKCCIVVTHDPVVAAGADEVVAFHEGFVG
ncbi:ABC transporter ATP-binding protein [Cellulosimicrobium funkei]